MFRRTCQPTEPPGQGTEVPLLKESIAPVSQGSLIHVTSVLTLGLFPPGARTAVPSQLSLCRANTTCPSVPSPRYSSLALNSSCLCCLDLADSPSAVLLLSVGLHRGQELRLGLLCPALGRGDSPVLCLRPAFLAAAPRGCQSGLPACGWCRPET